MGTARRVMAWEQGLRMKVLGMPRARGAGQMFEALEARQMLSVETPADLTGTMVNGWTSAGVKLVVSMRNSGEMATGDFKFTIYWSKDTTLDTGDVSLVTIPVSSLEGGKSHAQIVTAAFPPGTPGGTYQVLMKLDSEGVVAESNEMNNVVIGSPAVRVDDQPDLKVAAMSGMAGALAPGQVVSGLVTVQNLGKGGAVPSTVQIVLSKDKIFGNGDDIAVGSGEADGIWPGKATVASYSGVVSQSTPSGTYYVLAKADGLETVAESNETNNGLVGPAVTVVRPVVTVTGPAAKLPETDGKGVFTVTRTGGGLGAALDVRLEVGGSAVRGKDYVLKVGNVVLTEDVVTIPAKAGSLAVGIFTIGDTRIDGHQNVTVALLPGAGEPPAYTIGATKFSAAATILDDEPTVKLTASATKMKEDGFVVITASRSGGSNKAPLEIFLETTGTAIQGTDYKLVSMDGKTTFGGSVTIAANAASVAFKAMAIDDPFIEGDETFTVSLAGGAGDPTYSGDTSKNHVTVTILDNEPVVKLTAAPTKMKEDGFVTFTASRTGGSNKQALTVYFEVAGTAIEGTDYRLVSVDGKTTLAGSVTIPANAALVTFKAVGIDDPYVEVDETIALNLLPAPGTPTYTLDPIKRGATITLQDNEPVVSITPSTAKTSEPRGVVVMTVSRAGGNNKEGLKVFFETGGTATRGEDYQITTSDGKVALSDFFTIPARAASATFKVTVVDDDAVEGPENLLVRLVPVPEGAPRYTLNAAKNQTTVTIEDNEPRVSVTAVRPTASETNWPVNKGQFKFTRTGGNMAYPLTVPFTIINSGTGAAVLGMDYTLSAPAGAKLKTTDGVTVVGSITFAAGVSTVLLEVQAPGDAFTLEGTEQIVLNLTDNATFLLEPGKSGAVVNILDGKEV